MSIDDDIKALREKYPDLLQEFSDNDLAGEGFSGSELELETYAKIKSDYRKLPKSVREEQRAIQRASNAAQHLSSQRIQATRGLQHRATKVSKGNYNINDTYSNI